MKVHTLEYDADKGWSSDLNFTNGKSTLVIVFGTAVLDNFIEPIREIQKRFCNASIVGCSTAGEIFGTQLRDNSLSVAVVEFDKTMIKTVSSQVNSAAESTEAATTIAKQLKSDDLRGVFILSDGLSINGTLLVKELNQFFEDGVVITGGLAGDGARFNKTWTLIDDQPPRSNQIVAVGFYGENIEIGYGSKGGWDIFGPERKITSSKGNVVFEIDGQPALELYKKYLGDRAGELPASALLFPLAIRSNDSSEEKIVRTILAVNEADQSLTFAGDVPQGCRAQFMRANFERLIDGSTQAAKLANATLLDQNAEVLSIAISCVGRRLILGSRAEEEIEAVYEELPKSTQQVGFYSYGEISPLQYADCQLHNQTMTLTTFSEKS